MKTPATRSQPNLAIQIALPLDDNTTTAETMPAPSQQRLDDLYLCAWLRSRIELATLTLRDDSALCVTHSDQAQVWRLLRLAKTRGLLPLLRSGTSLGKVVAA